MDKSFDWILSCVNSSSNFFQFKSCENLINLFTIKYHEETGFKELAEKLKSQLDYQEVLYSVEV